MIEHLIIHDWVNQVLKIVETEVSLIHVELNLNSQFNLPSTPKRSRLLNLNGTSN